LSDSRLWFVGFAVCKFNNLTVLLQDVEKPYALAKVGHPARAVCHSRNYEIKEKERLPCLNLQKLWKFRQGNLSKALHGSQKKQGSITNYMANRDPTKRHGLISIPQNSMDY
jgi:hypothetical protein